MTVRLYTIEPRAGGFALAAPDSSLVFWFQTKASALAKVRSMVGAAAFQRARVTDRNDGGLTVQIMVQGP